jgi:polyhydroxyalkanoate synthase subunit PhaC
VTTGPSATTPGTDVRSLVANMVRVFEAGQTLLAEYFGQMNRDSSYQVLDPAVVTRTFQEAAAQALADPLPFYEQGIRFWADYMRLNVQTLARLSGWSAAPSRVVAAAPDDKRFKDEQWAENVWFDFIKQSYLLVAQHMRENVARAESLGEHSKRKLEFFTRQYISALSPANFAVTNPQVVKATFESGGENLIRGLKNMLDDLRRGKGQLRPRMTDLEAFKLGENVATTPGKVVFQNALMQLIQYAPTTATVFRRPLLIIPPWINKFYILDLKPKNSFIRWAVDQGHTVFVISWVNPDAKLAQKDFEDYLREGPLAALDAVGVATDEKVVNVIGYCIGGTLTASTLAYMAAKRNSRVASATFFATLLDFSDVGEISVFIDEDQIQKMEAEMRTKGYFDGAHMSQAFNLLRENDLIWSFYVNNYLLGRDPPAFDLLYWNSDSTRMPEKMHRFYLRNMYQRNRLREPGALTLGGMPIDLGKIRVPTYFLSMREDHIAPWKSSYAGTQLVSGPVTFVVGGSGHIAGVINPPAANKYGYWTRDALAATADEWLEGASHHEGSWWLHWGQWAAGFAGERVAAREPGDGALSPIEDAPGSYVKVRAG